MKLEYVNTLFFYFTVIPEALVSAYCDTDNRSNHVQGKERVLPLLLTGIILFVSRAKNEQQHSAVSVERALDWIAVLGSSQTRCFIELAEIRPVTQCSAKQRYPLTGRGLARGGM
jgi:hypothetical protein